MNSTLRSLNLSRILISLGLIAISFSITRFAYSDGPWGVTQPHRRCETGLAAVSCPPWYYVPPGPPNPLAYYCANDSPGKACYSVYSEDCQDAAAGNVITVCLIKMSPYTTAPYIDAEGNYSNCTESRSYCQQV